jgi:NADH-quinone oxidoreductase subunit H
VWFALKTLIVLYIFVWIRATLPRLRYDQLMDLGWKRMIPASLVMLMVIAGFQTTTKASGSGFLHSLATREWGWVGIGAAVILVAFFWRALDVGRETTRMEAAQKTRSLPEGDL